MIHNKVYPPRWYDGILGRFYRVAASGVVPPAWFREPLPPVPDRRPGPAVPTLEIISHCWRYSHMLAYQLSSFVLYPPSKLRAMITVFYAGEDDGTTKLLAFIGSHKVPNITWNWQALPKEQLFRRGIGRNRAALATQADWVWMTDCDIVFHKGCLDSLARQLVGRQEALLYPRQERTTTMLADSCPMLQKGRALQLVDIDTREFSVHSRDRAKGAFQIIHGDVARVIGYCDGIGLYQTPAAHWCKCYEDRAFRWLVGSQGTPIEVEGVCQIRHVEKGRYQQGTLRSRIRSKIRRMQE
ncbi:MAG TPA: glycosyl transferase [Verrucomicrobia bacterium]|nr:glycosyl transferase [Verrucomicrobiota bacterium]